MEKPMRCVSCSPKITKEINRADGSKSVLEFYEVRFSDGLDSIKGETSSNVTAQITASPLKVGSLYMVNARLIVRDTKNPQTGEPSTFFSCRIIDVALFSNA